MVYAVKEIFKTLQGEGGQAGKAAVFCRFTGCNLWSGREIDRAAAICRFCDTDFVGADGGKFSDAASLAAALAACWGESETRYRLVVFTGGEPLLQLDSALIAATRALGFLVAVETNGTLPAPAGIDWLCVSPKANAPLVLTQGTELKLVYPQEEAPPERFAALPFQHFWLQPMAGDRLAAHTEAAVAYCLRHPQWRVSLQTHKYMGIR